MNLTKVIIAGVVGGVALDLYYFVMHGFVMASAYIDQPAFEQEQANPLWFLLVTVCLGLAGAMLFAKTRDSWASGIKGGMVFGFWVGLIISFTQFFYPLVINNFPYHLAWCWGGIEIIGWVIMGLVIALIYKPQNATA